MNDDPGGPSASFAAGDATRAVLRRCSAVLLAVLASCSTSVPRADLDGLEDAGERDRRRVRVAWQWWNIDGEPWLSVILDEEGSVRAATDPPKWLQVLAPRTGEGPLPGGDAARTARGILTASEREALDGILARIPDVSYEDGPDRYVSTKDVPKAPGNTSLGMPTFLLLRDPAGKVRTFRYRSRTYPYPEAPPDPAFRKDLLVLDSFFEELARRILAP